MKRIELTPKEMEDFLERVRSKKLHDTDYEIILGMGETLAFLSQALTNKNISIKRLRKILFGATTEKTDTVLGNKNKGSKESFSRLKEESEKKKKGHGRNGAAVYKGAKKEIINHETLKHGDSCPGCLKGKVYEIKKPGTIVRITGNPPLTATVYELQKLRCNLCGEVFTATPPKDIGEEKYDAASGAMIGLLKYGSGLPFNRLDTMQNCLGIPLPSSTQWDIIKAVADKIKPIYNRLLVEGAQGDLFYNDDTTMKILSLMKGTNESERTGIFTSGIISSLDERKIALFFTGRKHAGENMSDVMKKRNEELSVPIQMCDALSRNMPKDFMVILANCIAHARRKFVDVTDNFPEECMYVLNVFKEIYKHDAYCKKSNMTPEERLIYHQKNSKSIMEDFKDWLQEQFDEKKVEPNSGLGDAISYMQNHWEALTLFLREPGAPLDNNICERALKKAILHRKNALFYKTETGAYVGDMFMSIIYTCNLNDVNPFDYLVQLQNHSEDVKKNPEKWLPWNYKKNLSDDAHISSADQK
ncbi:MAG: IS66 family transposase [Candidatus Altiarchaeota archaeon]|nr:IS66 family transposase [Candidatus Altiarchaeota archaeon]